MLHQEAIIITIDGGVACGKSTLAQLLAQKLDYIHLDTGAIYRAIALFLDRNNLACDADENQISQQLTKLNLYFPPNKSGNFILHLVNSNSSEDISELIRSPKISQLASIFATLATVRAKATNLQQDFARQYKGIVADGRDMGTVVFPKATVKFFLSASIEVRAKRRYQELKNKNINISYTAVLDELKIRDQRDLQRSLSPLKPADDAIVLENSELDLNSQLEIMYITVQKIKQSNN